MSSQGNIPRRGLPHIGRIARFRSAPKSDRVAPECASNRLSRARPTTGTPYTREKWTPMIGQGDKWSCPDSVSGVSRVRGCFARCFGISIPPFVFPGTSLPLFCHVPTPSEIKKRTIVRFSSCPPPVGRSPPPVPTRGNVGTPHRRRTSRTLLRSRLAHLCARRQPTTGQGQPAPLRAVGVHQFPRERDDSTVRREAERGQGRRGPPPSSAGPRPWLRPIPRLLSMAFFRALRNPGPYFVCSFFPCGTTSIGSFITWIWL